MNDRQEQAVSALINEHSKDQSLEPSRERLDGTRLTTDQGVGIPNTDDSLTAGARGPTLLEDFHFREKITRFDHERIPERVVHARGSAAHGYFQVYESLADITRAAFLQDPSVKTPVFVRFSTVVGSRGSADTVRDVRGFATKFYTSEGNFDLVGNNMPVFFIQDGIKFPDLVHAVKPEPHNEMPQGASAHDTFWDFASLVPEITHMLMWVLSDRALPRSYRMMEGFGVHTFRLVNAAGASRFVKFHWKPLLGVHSLTWDEAQKLAGKDADFHRRDLWEAIERGDYPEYELGLQVIEEADEHAFGVDLLDPTKLIPEELAPVRRVGKLTLNRNPDNFFAETEQVAFCVQNVVPGVDFTNDPLMQARLFSYLDTQLLRLGGPNFAQIPINRPVAPVHNHQQDGLMQQKILTTRANYHPNSLGGGCPMLTPEAAGGFVHYAQAVAGATARRRSATFSDHYSQAALFWNSMSAAEKDHIVLAARFELGKVESMAVRTRMVDQFNKVDGELARRVAEGIGVPPPGAPPQGPIPIQVSPALSMENTIKNTIRSRKIAILAEEGVSGAEIARLRAALVAAGARVEIVASLLGAITTLEGDVLEVDKSFALTESIAYDAVLVAGGATSVVALRRLGDAIHFINEAFRHGKPIGAIGEGIDLIIESSVTGVNLAAAPLDLVVVDQGVVTTRATADLGEFADAFVSAVAAHRYWGRSASSVPA